MGAGRQNRRLETSGPIRENAAPQLLPRRLRRERLICSGESIQLDKMISDDAFIELLTAGLSRLSMPEADVQWNAKVDGRQFDVLVTYKIGLHSVLLAYEVKDKKRPVSVDQIDAFVTKARDVGANKTVFVSTAGFQSGAISVAKRHHMDLFKLSFVDGKGPKLPKQYVALNKAGHRPTEAPFLEETDAKLANAVERISLEYADGTHAALPDEMSQMTYYAAKIVDETGASLDSFIGPYVTQDIGMGTLKTIRIPTDVEVTAPDNYFVPSGRVRCVEVDVIGREMKGLRGNVQMETSSFSMPVRYENVVTGEHIESDISQLPVGPREPKVGSYYFMYFPLRYYYCDSVSGGRMTLYLVESFQMGELLQAVFKQETKYIAHYMPLTDKGIEARLHQRLQRMKSRE